MMIERIIASPEAMEELAGTLAPILRGGDVLALHGPLGAGKTCFVRGLAGAMGVDQRDICSPTFVICHDYALPPGTGGSVRYLLHLDGYRVTSAEDLHSLGFDELLARTDAVLAIEWAERFGDELPHQRLDIEIEHVNEQTRRVVLNTDRLPTDARARLLAVLRGDPADEVEAQEARCVVCGTPVAQTASNFPFCSQRCRMVDLGQWFGGAYRTSRPIEEADL